VVLVAIATVTTGGAVAQESDSAKLETVTLQLKWKHQFQFAGYYAAVKQGYYREAGLEVVLREAGAGQDIEDTVLSGEADFGTSTSDLVLRYAEGAPVVALAPIYQHSPLVFLVTASARVNNLHELAGKRVALEPHAAELLAYLKVEGVPTEELNFGNILAICRDVCG
jgi:ABC-type nitrate/sulfonate/bicarbonate transport system substrate-binding protein